MHNKTALTIALNGLMYCLLAPILYIMEYYIGGQEIIRMALPLCLLALFFFLVTSCEMLIVRQWKATNSKILTNGYLMLKMMRLLLSVILLTCYLLLKGPQPLYFAISLLVFYFAAIIFTTIIYVKSERKQTNEKDKK